MIINWKEEANKRKDDLLKDLETILRIDSVRDDSKSTPDSPLGPGPREALEAFLAIGERDGFVTKNIDNLAGHIEFGDGEELMGVFGHVDVVPTGTGWNSDPFTPTIKDNRLYARGASDDKGPTMAAYHAIKLIRDLNLPTSKKLRLIIGTDEESGWACMTRYLEVERTPDFGFSPDADFPIINGEKGILTLHVETVNQNQSTASTRIKQFDAGLRENMVPQDAKVVLITNMSQETLSDRVNAFMSLHGVSATVVVNKGEAVIEMIGKASHGMAPMNGVNAATYLALLLSELPLEGNDRNFVDLIVNYLHTEHWGQKLGVAYVDDVMGDVTMNPGVFQYDGVTGRIALNFRYPKGVTEESLTREVTNALAGYHVIIKAGKSQTPHYVPADDPLVKVLLDVYEKHTGEKGSEKTIGGGTYGRLLERGVAYGAMFPHSIDTMHQANEFIDLDDLFNAFAIYAEAIYELIK